MKKRLWEEFVLKVVVSKGVLLVEVTSSKVGAAFAFGRLWSGVTDQWDASIIKHWCLGNDTQGTNDWGSGKNPQEEPVQNHSYKLPVLFNLQADDDIS